MHYSIVHRILALCIIALLCTVLPQGRVQAAQQLIYDDALGQGWSNYSWATVNLDANAPFHGGSKSIAVTYGAWEGLYLAYPGMSTLGMSKLRFWIHGGTIGGQQLQVYIVRASDSSGQHGPEIQVTPAPAANTWHEVQIPLADLGAANTTINGIVWQDRSGGSQPALYIDDIALIDDASPDGPVLSDGAITPGAAPADGATSVVVRARVSDPQGAADISSVTLDGTALGRGTIALRDDGHSNDGASGDGLFGTVLTVASGTASGEVVLLVSARDQAGHTASLNLGAFVVLSAAGGTTPTGLPQQISWGTNEWNENSVQDWQVASGVPWGYAYQYITYEWYLDGWGGDFVGRFARQAWSKGYIPVISAYLMLATPPACGESATCYAQKLQNPAAVSAYLAALQEAARQAQGEKPVIFHIDPDFYGFMQQLSNDPANRPAGVIPDDPNSYPVALNIAGYPNTLAGFGRRIVDVVHTTAPNALVAPHASMWATNLDPNIVAPDQVASLGQRTAAFINAMGGAQADLLFVEWSDRDAGSGLRPWWDDTNRQLPRPSRAVLWENALSAASGKRLILWQMPSGNMSLDNTCNHYQDNRAAYAFAHPRDLYDAGVIAILFGGGATCMTAPSTDGGFIQAQGGIAYAPPATPSGLSAGAVDGATVSLHWQENSEPDLWGYQVLFQRAGGPVQSVDARRANSFVLLLPDAGEWIIRIVAYDAMGNLSPQSAPVNVTTTTAPERVYLPLVGR